MKKHGRKRRKNNEIEAEEMKSDPDYIPQKRQLNRQKKNERIEQQNGFYTLEKINRLKSEAEVFINEIYENELFEAQQKASKIMSFKDFSPQSVEESVFEASAFESGFIYVISSLNKLFGVAEKDSNAQTVFESMLSLGMLKMRYSSSWLHRSELGLTSYTEPSDVGKMYLQILCKITQGTDENERKQTDVIMKKILHEISVYKTGSTEL